MLRRRVRVAEYHVGTLEILVEVSLYDESSESFHGIKISNLIEYAHKDKELDDPKSILLICPNIEHYMLGLLLVVAESTIFEPRCGGKQK